MVQNKGGAKRVGEKYSSHIGNTSSDVWMGFPKSGLTLKTKTLPFFLGSEHDEPAVHKTSPTLLIVEEPM